MKIDHTVIDRVLDNQASAEEAREVNQWFTTDEGRRHLSERMEREASSLTEEEMERWVDHPIPEAKMKARFLEQLSPKKKKISSRYRWMAAAVMVPFLVLSLSILFLADRAGLFSPTEYAELTVPCGEQMQVALQDGTLIQLNSNSRLRYPKKFGLFNRTVELWGEGYFSVAKERSRPFVVNLHSIEVEVTGTKFNVKAYPYETNIYVTLDEGGVFLKDSKNQKYILHPGESADYNRQSGICRIMKPDDSSTSSAWRSNSLNFYLTPLGEIIKVMERQYDVHFIVTDSALLTSRFTLSTNKVNVIDILHDLETVSHICFKQKEEGTFEILPKE